MKRLAVHGGTIAKQLASAHQRVLRKVRGQTALGCRAGALGCCALVLACSSEIEAPPPATTDGSGAATSTVSSVSSTTGVGGSSGTSTTGGTGATGTIADPDPSVVTRVARLTHAQYHNTIVDLFGVTDTPAGGFAPDALNGFAFDSSVNLAVDARLGPQYRTAAEQLALLAVSDAEVRSRVVPCASVDNDCRDQFIASFGERAFRRPLSAQEVTRFTGLFDRGPELVASGDAFNDGVQLVVEAILQSPQFLYRTELSNDASAEGLIALNDWELATRLAYFLHNSMPTPELFELARSGSLRAPQQVTTAVTTLLAGDRALPQLVSFHDQAWHFDRFSSISPDSATYPVAPGNLSGLVREAASRFVEDVIDTGGGLAELLTAPYAFADSALAPLYGTTVAGSFSRVDFDPTQRKGLLMQVGFLAANAHTIKTDPIHRGLFVVRDLLCRDIPDPPPGASTSELPATSEPPETTREEVELLTGQVGCVSCHAVINPAGFAFEGFDAVGQQRSTENGVPVDTSGSFELDQKVLIFSGPIELVDALAASPEARNCYAGKWLEFAYGRDLAAGDEASVAALGATPSSVQELVALVATSSAFMNRIPNEVAP